MLSLWKGEVLDAPAAYRPTMRQIATEVAEKHGVRLRDLTGRETGRIYVRARFEAMTRIRDELNFSLPQIGRFFNRDHTTVINALRRYPQMVEAD